MFNLYVLCRKVANALVHIMRVVADRDRRWIFAVPLYHFLTNTVKPFARRSFYSSHRQPQWWGIADFEMLIDNIKKSWRTQM